MSNLIDSMKSNSQATVRAKQQADAMAQRNANNAAPSYTIPPPACPDVSPLNASILERNATIAEQKARIRELETSIPDIKTNVYNLGNDLSTDGVRMHRANTPKSLPTLLISLVLLAFFVVVYLFYDALLVPRIMKELQGDILFPIKQIRDEQAFAAPELDYTKKWADISRMLNYARFQMFAVVFLGLFGMINLLYMLWLRGNDITLAYRVGSLTLFIVLGLTFLLVNNQTMIKPFENVVGYAWLQTFSRPWVQETLSGLFEHRLWKGEHGAFPETRLSYDFLVSVFRIDTFRDTIDDLLKDLRVGDDKYKYDLRFKTGKGAEQAEHVKDLYRMSLRKNTVGHMCWIYFASLASVMISMKYLARLG